MRILYTKHLHGKLVWYGYITYSMQCTESKFLAYPKNWFEFYCAISCTRSACVLFTVYKPLVPVNKISQFHHIYTTK